MYYIIIIMKEFNMMRQDVLKYVFSASSALSVTAIAHKVLVMYLESRIPSPNDMLELGAMGIGLMIAYEYMKKSTCKTSSSSDNSHLREGCSSEERDETRA